MVKNALEAFERKGIPLKQREIRISVLSDQYALIIEDNAGGVDPKFSDRIFSRYVSVKGIQKQTGLGLFNARKAIEKLEGRLDFPEKQPEHGTRFEIIMNGEL